ncbi:hypothetical protein DENSPDRAFT_690905 [Dentipellis sp. KUC8613]|nr:hypothetical protein DENSPDRAFT_690905 [Dentipellis sp. KUC8613]
MTMDCSRQTIDSKMRLVAIWKANLQEARCNLRRLAFLKQLRHPEARHPHRLDDLRPIRPSQAAHCRCRCRVPSACLRKQIAKFPRHPQWMIEKLLVVAQPRFALQGRLYSYPRPRRTFGHFCPRQQCRLATRRKSKRRPDTRSSGQTRARARRRGPAPGPETLSKRFLPYRGSRRRPRMPGD